MVKVDPILYALFSTFILFWRCALYCHRIYGNILSALTGMTIIEDNPRQEQENVGSQAMDTDAALSTQVMKC